MNKFKDITNIINSDLKTFEDFLCKLVSSDSSEHDIIGDILNYVFEVKGKRIRPVLVYLSSRLFNKPTKSTDIAALLIEIIHTATLLHDDVVDEALLRRGRSSVNYKWDDKTAVLSGDFLFAKAMKIATDNQEYKLFDIITPAIMHLSIGELLQMESSRNFSIDEDKYYETIKYKTASLISVCCEAGAYSAGASQNDIELCRQFGEKLGCIFQIKDDILDYVGNDKTGKQIGIDIKEKKVTLPLICAWYNIDEDHKRRVSGLWSSIDHNSENFKEIIEIVVENKGISECEKVMKKLKSNALEVLNKFNDSEAKLALAKLLDYIIEREK